MGAPMIESRQGQSRQLTHWLWFLLLASTASIAAPQPADLVITGGHIYTGARGATATDTATATDAVFNLYIGFCSPMTSLAPTPS